MEEQEQIAISLAEVKEILGDVDLENMDQIQRWTYDYVSKFATTEPANAKEMKKQLLKECNNLTEKEVSDIMKHGTGSKYLSKCSTLTIEEAVEIVNIRPTSLAELRSFTFGWKKLILAETLEKMLKIIKEYT